MANSGKPDWVSPTGHAASRGDEYVNVQETGGYTRGKKRGFYSGVTESREGPKEGGSWPYGGTESEYRYYPRTKRTYRMDKGRATEVRAGRRDSRR